MNHIPLDIILRSELLARMAGVLDLPVILGNQTAGQGRTDGIYFTRIGDGKNGWQHRSYEETNGQLILTENQWIESQYQFQALVDENLNTVLTASDAISITRMIVSSLSFTESLASKGIGVQRPSDVLIPSFVNEKEQFDTNPNFTIIFSHKRELAMTVPHLENTVVGTVHVL